jgi:alpha-beta hydrolase superfamily lysophospholipase
MNDLVMLLAADATGGWLHYVLIGLAIFVGSHIVMAYPLHWLVALIVFNANLKRKNRQMWSRERSANDEESIIMYDEGLQWAKEHAHQMSELHIVNDGLNLYAEYYDLGYERAVIIISGRTEGLRYGYYFARPYSESGFNVLCIDQRAHGNSDGKYNSIGFNEHRDVIKWAELLHESFGVKLVTLHGICIGSACGLYALTSKDCPEYLNGLVADGMYVNFYETFKNHMIEFKKPTFLVLDMIDVISRHKSGGKFKYGPIDVIDKYTGPFLMLHGKADNYSLPEKAEELLAKAGSKNKKIVFFEGGRHSKLRILDSELYDSSIKEYIARTFDDSLVK